MEQVTPGDQWRSGSNKVLWTVGAIDGAKAVLNARSSSGEVLTEEVQVTSLAAGDGGWRKITVEGEAERYGVTRAAALRIIWAGEEEHEAARNATYLWDRAKYPDDVDAHVLDEVLEQYGATLQPNPDAISFITGEIRDRMARAAAEYPPLTQVPDAGVPDELSDDDVDKVARAMRAEMHKPRSISDTIQGLRDAGQYLADYVPSAVREAARLYPGVIALLESAAERLDELSGPGFDAYYCATCGNIVPAAVLERQITPMLAGLMRVTWVIKNDLGEEHTGSYMECENYVVEDLTRPGAPAEEPHGPMRLVRCRVTADVPEAEREEEVATA